MINLIEVVHQCIHENTIFSLDFSQQVYCYCYLFLLLGFILPTKQGNLYIQLLDKTIGLEQYFMITMIIVRICSLSIRFFFLTKVRQIISHETINSIHSIGYHSIEHSIEHSIAIINVDLTSRSFRHSTKSTNISALPSFLITWNSTLIWKKLN